MISLNFILLNSHNSRERDDFVTPDHPPAPDEWILRRRRKILETANFIYAHKGAGPYPMKVTMKIEMEIK